MMLCPCIRYWYYLHLVSIFPFFQPIQQQDLSLTHFSKQHIYIWWKNTKEGMSLLNFSTKLKHERNFPINLQGCFGEPKKYSAVQDIITLSLSHAPSHSHSLTHTLSLTYPLTRTLSLNLLPSHSHTLSFTLLPFNSQSHQPSHSHSLSHSPILSLTLSPTLSLALSHSLSLYEWKSFDIKNYKFQNKTNLQAWLYYHK